MLKTKLHRPPVTVEHVYREHLINQLNKNLYKPLTLVSAPAGYGKSMLISSWLEKCKCPFAWVSLNKDDNEFRSFLSCIYQSIIKIHPNSLRDFGKLIDINELPPYQTISETLINELDDISNEFVFVLDDYHLINNQQIHELLDLLLKYPPENMHLVMLTRRDPALNLSSLRAHSRMNEIRMNDLAFDEVHTSTLFKNLLNVELKKNTTESLLEKTEGWITGLRLASLIIGDEDVDKVLKNLQGDFHLISDYLIGEVLHRQPENTQQHLLFSSILNRFNASVLDKLFNDGLSTDSNPIKGEEFIQWLIKVNLFIIPLDNNQEWFRFHHLFQELMQNHLKQKYTAEQIKKVHLVASKWFEKNKLIEEAIYHAIEAEELETAALIIERNREKAVNSDKWYILDNWLDRLPEEFIRERPGLLMAKSWVLLHHLQFEEVFANLEQIEKLCGEGEEFNSILGEVALFRGYMLYFLGDSQSSLAFLEIALEKIPLTYYEARAQTEVIFASASQMVGKMDQGIQFLDDLYANPKPTNDVRESRLLVTYVFIHFIAGDLKNALKANDRLFKLVNNNLAYGEAWARHLYGVFHLYLFNLHKSIDYLQGSINQRYILFTRTAVDSMTALILAYQISGQNKKAIETLQLLREFVSSTNDPSYQLLLKTAEIRFSLMSGNIENALKINQTISLPSFEPGMIWWIEIPSITYCKALIAEGTAESLKEAVKKLDELHQICTDQHNMQHLMQIFILIAIVKCKTNEKENALEALTKAIEMAQASSFLFPFIEMGDQIMDLLLSLKKKGIALDFVDRLLFEINNITRSTTDSPDQPNNYKNTGSAIEFESLSLREQDVMNLLSKGLRNKEIAENLFISVDTVKKHLKNIFLKLDVSSRIHAVKKAEDLGILETE